MQEDLVCLLFSIFAKAKAKLLVTGMGKCGLPQGEVL